MSETVNNEISVIKLEDPNLPEYLDFEKLRREGLEHIGNLSGKIWTDHNVHDPGITILEVLVYALIDLGYKTNLPFEDLIAIQNHQEKDDNFLTPLEILTINPVTVTDYRKLVLEIEGVRNAWLEPTDQETNLYLDIDNNTLSCDQGSSSSSASRLSEEFRKIHLNGLYKVYIEKEEGIHDAELKAEVKKTLANYRNLCEDFVDKIVILQPLDFGICLEAELHPGYVAEKVYTEIFTALKHFIQPEINYYTLSELLDKGKAIEDIFSGRPYRTQSFGFLDTEELENFDRKKQFNLSDAYKVVLNIEGVRKIKKITINGGDPINVPSYDWIEGNRIEEGFVPVFSMDETCIDLYNKEGLLRLDKTAIHKTLSFNKKFTMPLSSLDTSIPLGRYREDLSEYYAVQNDFPVVYGIGEDGLPESATLLRKTQALQLKGYLMFYDQMLANYTSQLANIRSLFSLKPENQRSEEEKQTYFTQIPETVPGLQELLRFYDPNETVPAGSQLAVPVSNNEQWKTSKEKLQNNPSIEFTIGDYCNDKKGLVDLFSFSSVGVRNIYINQLVDSFFNEQYTIEVLSDKRGYFFVIQAGLPDDILMIGIKRYISESEARKEAKKVAFIGTMSQSYHLVTDASDTILPDSHYFDITYSPLSYIDLIQELTEDKDEYAIRRKQFLDHLLARFGEEFTDYTLLQYQNNISAEAEIDDEIDSQSIYINEFAEVGRNRGKAFNYLEPSWNTNNVSGFEKRVSLLSGISNYERRNLCNFEVVQSFRLVLNDESGNTFFRSNTGYETKEELSDAAQKVLKQLRNPDTYKQLEKSLNGFDAHAMHRIFSEQPAEENIIITKYHYHQQLCNTEKEVVVESKSMKMRSEKAALDKKEDFVKNINTQTIKIKAAEEKEYRLLPLDDNNNFLNVNALDCDIQTLITWKWHVNEIHTKETSSSEQVFEVYDDAWDHMVREAKLNNYLTVHEVALKWRLAINEDISISGVDYYPDAYKAVAGWRQAKVLGSGAKNYVVKEEGASLKIEVKNEKGNIIAVSNTIDPAQKEAATIIEECVTVFSNRNTKPEYDKERNKFGFQIVGKDSTAVLISNCVYNTEKEALQQLENIFKQGENKKNYLLSGDQGNPEYNFILRDQYDSFLALPPDHFETAADRTKALNAMIRYFKSNKLPVFVKEEPRRYVWSLLDNEKKILQSATEFSSKARAQADFDKVVVAEAIKSNNELFKPHCYEFSAVATPAQYKFIYGTSNAQNDLEPLFISTDTFTTREEASKAYTAFMKELPALSFKSTSKGTHEFILNKSDKKTEIATQYTKEGTKASPIKAKAVIEYANTMYTKNLEVKEAYINREMVENQEGRYEWRFYKKNAPLATSPYRCPNRSLAEHIKSIICDATPPINLKQCPAKEIVVCPEKSPNKYHYQVCFKDDKNNEFVLISYVGYDTYEEAEAAWHKNWLDVIEIARKEIAYNTYNNCKDDNDTPGGENDPLKDHDCSISIDEVYKTDEDKSCNDASFIVVIPEKIRQDIEAREKNVIEYYTKLADLFPIYKITDENDQISYRYKVTKPEVIFSETGCTIDTEIDFLGSLLWESVYSYDALQKAIGAYQHFYNLAGTANNCRIFCEKGDYYVGLVEVLAESIFEFDSDEQAWDDSYPNTTDNCQNCIPGGVREFVYAAEEDKNYIPVCDSNYWKFKVVSPAYFVSDHNCHYNASKERDEQMNSWISRLENLDWNQYIVEKPSDGGSTRPGGDFLYWIGYGYSDKQFCDFMLCLRESLIQADKVDKQNRNAAIKSFLKEKYKDDRRVYNLIDEYNFSYEIVQDLTNYFPVYKTDTGYCYRLYWSDNDIVTTPDGLQPCGCTDVITNDDPCQEPYPFMSSNYYHCCTEALQAFIEFSSIIIDRSYTAECTETSEYGPYSFQIINKQRELAYHPQQYDSLQEVKDAIELTKNCVTDVGMHLLEHILLRPKKEGECKDVFNDADGNRVEVSCLLPVCPDDDCAIEWHPDMDKDDPCAVSEPLKIHYVPGSDPYSFWATLVLPSWAKRFRTKEDREAFENFLYKEVPALVGLHILWLSPRDMCKFEETYRKWLVWKQDPSAPGCDLDGRTINCLLAECIRDLQSESPCPSIPGAQGDCNCNGNDDRMVLPEDSQGSIFWGYCPPDIPDPQETPGVDIAATAVIEAKPATKTAAQKKKPVKKVAVSKKETPKTKRVKEQPKKAQSSTEKKTPVKKPVVKKTSTKKTTPKKEAAKKTTPKTTVKDILTNIRKRKPKYLANIKAAADTNMVKTKSYERAVFFLENTPTITAYKELVDFFNKYSLQKDNNLEVFIELLKNATWHLLDKLVLDEKEAIKKEDIDHLKSCLTSLKKKGLSLKEVYSNWKSDELGSLANAAPLAQIQKLLK